MEERELKGIVSQYHSIIENAEEIMQKAWNLDNAFTRTIQTPLHKPDAERDIKQRISKLIPETKALLQSYNDSIYDCNKSTGLKLRAIIISNEIEATLYQIIIECKKVTGALENEISLLSSEEMSKLTHLKQEAKQICEKIDINFEKNLEESIMEAEKGHFLASTLETCRIIDYIISQLDGKTIENKIDNLIKLKVIDHDNDKIRQNIMKADKKARNYLNHRIDTYAKSSDALSLLGDCLFLLDTYSKIQ